MSGKVTVMFDSTDDFSVARAAWRLHAPLLGRIIVDPTPSVHSTAALAHDVLAALGKPPHRIATEGISSDRQSWRAAAAWILGERIQQLIVLRAHLQSPDRWLKMIELQRVTAIHMVLICHSRSLPPAIEEILATGENQRVTCGLESALEPVADLERHDGWQESGQAAPSELPSLPSSEFTRFRADAYRQLSNDEFSAVDVEYGRGIDAACAWLASHIGYRADTPPTYSIRSVVAPFLLPVDLERSAATLAKMYSDAQLEGLAEGLWCLGRKRPTSDRYPYPWDDEGGLQVFLTDLVADSSSQRHTLARVRGAQAGFLLHGLLLHALPDLSTSGPGVGGPSFTPAMAARIRTRIAHPQRAAALATALFTHANHDSLARILISQLRPDATSLQMPLRDRVVSYAVPAPARGLLRAAQHFAGLRISSESTGNPWQLLGPGTGSLGDLLQEDAAICSVVLPARLDGHSEEPWHCMASCWWVADPLHGPEPNDCASQTLKKPL
ncbi:hypothetical protein [Planotetraspora phitsanulokensis]|nr:hypothetical protein [Planotetraspora phitsanulokensis]